MGFFSWRNLDTGKAIMNNTTGDCSESKSTMSDNKGQKFVEECYGGYGVFGGKDYYSLLAEMNPKIAVLVKPKVNVNTADEDTLRDIGITIEFGSYQGVIYPNLNEDENVPYDASKRCVSANGQGHWEEDYGNGEGEEEEEEDY